jgi:hypothetical protein
VRLPAGTRNVVLSIFSSMYYPAILHSNNSNYSSIALSNIIASTRKVDDKTITNTNMVPPNIQLSNHSNYSNTVVSGYSEWSYLYYPTIGTF